jgi:hypothetical protein
LIGHRLSANYIPLSDFAISARLSTIAVNL